MAHVHGAASAAKESLGHAGHGAGAMAGHGAGGHGASMASGAGHNLARGAMTAGAVAAARSNSGRGLMSALTKSPLIMFGLGVAAGVLAYKYRKEIIGAAARATEKGKDFALQQKENLEDLVAECKECPDDSAESSSSG